MKRTKWTPEMVSKLAELYPTHTASECADLIGVDLHVVQRKVLYLGLKKTLKKTDATGNVRLYNITARHPVLRKMRHRDPNQEIERAISSLSGFVIGIERIDVDGLDSSRSSEWAAELKNQISVINRFIRRVSP